MKGFVLLAILLLIPSVGYFQRQIFLERLQPGLEKQVEGLLREERVKKTEVPL